MRQAQTLLEEARFHRISQVEFNYDAGDDADTLMEINGRSWSWIRAAAFSGTNLPLIQYDDLTGDARPADAIASARRDGNCFVRDALVKLNGLPFERKLIEEVGRRKTLVSAVSCEQERRLGIVYRLATVIMIFTGSGAVMP